MNANRRPVYTRIWFWLAILMVGVSITVALKNQTKINASDQQLSTKGTDIEDSVLRQAFDTIQLGNLGLNGQGGSTLVAVKKIFGEPTSSNFSYIDGISSNVLTWEDLRQMDSDASLFVSFVNEKAISKSLMDLAVAPRAKATLTQYNAIKTDGSYTTQQALKDFGEPNGINETILNGKTKLLWSWTKNVSGPEDANFTLNFIDGVATMKTQSGLTE